jgi:putative FmdB family regulatory protein
MPLYEYRCRDCEKRFEEVVLGNAKPRCPSCEGRKIDKLLSVFAVGSGGGRTSSSAASETPSGTGSCGSCGDPRGPGSCAVN